MNLRRVKHCRCSGHAQPLEYLRPSGGFLIHRTHKKDWNQICEQLFGEMVEDDDEGLVQAAKAGNFLRVERAVFMQKEAVTQP